MAGEVEGGAGDLAEEPEDPINEATTLKTLVLREATQTQQEVIALTKIRVFLLWIKYHISNALRTQFDNT